MNHQGFRHLHHELQAFIPQSSTLVLTLRQPFLISLAWRDKETDNVGVVVFGDDRAIVEGEQHTVKLQPGKVEPVTN